jgi:AcrR family transcriptional regulator
MVSMATQAERSAGTRARLLEAAVACLVERGYFGTSTAEVCRRAGVTRGAQLHHYPTKAALLGAAVEHVMALRHDEFRRAVAGGPRRLDRTLAGLWTIYAGPTVAAWQELVVAARTDAELHEVVRRVNHRFEREAEATFRAVFPGVPAARVRAGARLVMALFDGLALNHGLDRDDALARAVTREVARLLGVAWTSPRARRGRA